MPVITNVEDLRTLHRRRTPRVFYEYVDSGSWTESTYHANEAAFRAVRLRQRVAVDLGQRSIRSQMLDEPVAMPVALAPVGLTGMQIADGEILAARAAERFGVPYTLSTMSICSIEDVASHTSKPFWFQLYMMRDRAFVARLIDRAKAAGCSALVLTLDLPILGQRHRDIKNGLAVGSRPSLAMLLGLITRPRWCLGMLRTPRRSFGNIVGHAEGVDELGSLSAWSAMQLDPTVDWDDVAWVRRHWGGKFVLKGIMDVEDARRAADAGADAIVVSNHGGRQLDGAPAALEALPRIVDAVGERLEVWMDGGIRSGQDVLKALALGARGTLIGRAYVYGLGALGEAGVHRCLELIANELDLTMAFCGITDLSDVDGRILWHDDGEPPAPGEAPVTLASSQRAGQP
jgi:L-lactate dehydrogenase (cytochrome)